MSMQKARLTLSTVANGGAEKQFQGALDRILESFKRGEDPKVARKVTIELTVSEADGGMFQWTSKAVTKLPGSSTATGFAEQGADGGFTAILSTPPAQEDMFARQGVRPIAAAAGGAGEDAPAE